MHYLLVLSTKPSQNIDSVPNDAGLDTHTHTHSVMT